MLSQEHEQVYFFWCGLGRNSDNFYWDDIGTEEDDFNIVNEFAEVMGLKSNGGCKEFSTHNLARFRNGIVLRNLWLIVMIIVIK